MSSFDRPGRPDDIRSAVSPSDASTSKNNTSRAGKLVRNATQTFTQSSPPVGMFHAYGSIGSNMPTMADIQKGNFNHKGWSGPGQRRNSRAHRHTDFHVLHLHHQEKNSTPENKTATVDVEKAAEELDGASRSQAGESSVVVLATHDPSVPYPNGYQFPPKHTKWDATRIGLRASWSFVTTPFGFIVTIYALNVVAWGGMLFLILCHATPALGHPSYKDDSSKAKIWLEIDSQILNALFCVTGLGLIPWRFRDLYYLLQWRWNKRPDGLRRLAGIHRGWFRLQGSQLIDVKYHPAKDPLPPGIDESALAIPIALSPDPPLTGERAPPSVEGKLDFVVWAFVINSLLQIMLCGFMWGENRFHRPGWVVGLLISVACIVAMAGGWVIFKEGKKVKKLEGVPVSKEDQEILRKMREREGESA